MKAEIYVTVQIVHSI